MDEEEALLCLALTEASTLGVCIASCICIGERDDTFCRIDFVVALARCFAYVEAAVPDASA